MSESSEWRTKNSTCAMAVEGFEPYHKWIPISTIGTPGGSQIVTGLMCGICFQEVLLSEAHKHRDAD